MPILGVCTAYRESMLQSPFLTPLWAISLTLGPTTHPRGSARESLFQIEL